MSKGPQCPCGNDEYDTSVSYDILQRANVCRTYCTKCYALIIQPPPTPPEKTNVVPIGGITKLDMPADQVLSGALAKLDSVVLVGMDKEGEYYFASSMADGAEALWLLEKLKQRLLNVGEEDV